MVVRSIVSGSAIVSDPTNIAPIVVRNRKIVRMDRRYGMTIRTCTPADPQTKGGSETTVRIAKGDLVPTSANLPTRRVSWDATISVEGVCYLS